MSSAVGRLHRQLRLIQRPRQQRRVVDDLAERPDRPRRRHGDDRDPRGNLRQAQFGGDRRADLRDAAQATSEQGGADDVERHLGPIAHHLDLEPVTARRGPPGSPSPPARSPPRTAPAPRTARGSSPHAAPARLTRTPPSTPAAGTSTTAARTRFSSEEPLDLEQAGTQPTGQLHEPAFTDLIAATGGTGCSGPRW